MSTVPDTLLSSYNYLHITFVTDGSVQNRGFVVNYTTIEVGAGRGPLVLELQTKVHEDFTITEKALTRAFSWLKKCVLTTKAFTFKTL